ncbi:MAG: cytochrome-c oxidase, cbb3-type subunit I [Opitutales bacterium]|nr:cytochrome-c oxidase, cbb3-type subunit I [Opitutales bacterium]
MNTLSSNRQVITYDDHHVRLFMLASIFWGMIGMIVGALIALQMNFPALNFETSWLTFGRLRPLHTNAVIFALVGNMMFAGIYHSTQRLCKTRMANDWLTRIHFWGWQSVIVLAAVTLPLGLTKSKEYAELIWPIDILVVVVWVIFAINFFWTLAKRNEPTLYVAIWFYIATIVTVAMLYVVNNLAIPTSLTHSYPIFSGVQDALIQWWYGHNAVAFFLTTPILGLMYYYVPKAANRPVYSYRLSIVHFWSLVFIYIWAGPHHLLNTSLPSWLQTLGMIFSLMLWAPSWGGMLNGLLTLRGAWHKLRTDPVLKFFVAGITFYGMATFEGPLLSIRTVNALAHYTDWIIAHVHLGAMGWNGMMAAGLFYFLAPRIWKTKLYSVQLANMHFWIGLFGILLYVSSMWASGITQGLMLNATEEGGTSLVYANFVETLDTIRPLMLTRAFGGILFLTGWLLMIYNLWKTIRGAEPVDGTVEVSVDDRRETVEIEGTISPAGTLFNWPMFYSFWVMLGLSLWFFGGGLIMLSGVMLTAFFSLLSIVHFQASRATWAEWYERLIGNWAPFTVLVFIAVAIGGVIQIIPTLVVQKAKNLEGRVQVPYTPLELAGRDIYIAEGCYTCHSQQIRTLRSDVLRYGDYSRIGESIYDFPFQWGSKRTGPDLSREGGKRPNSWHFDHMEDPLSTSPGSNMPPYPWLLEQDLDFEKMHRRIRVQRMLGVPYPDWSKEEVVALMEEQADEIVADLRSQFRSTEPRRQIVALIAYLQKLGTYETPEEARERIESSGVFDR